MMPNPHMYGHHQYTPQGDSAAWMHQQNTHHQHAAAAAQQQAAAAAAAATAAQQQHYTRIASAHPTAALASTSHSGQDDAMGPGISEDNRRTLAYIADLLTESTREAALLELSKKREQVPELALILWHSFGKALCPFPDMLSTLSSINENVLTAVSDRTGNGFNRRRDTLSCLIPTFRSRLRDLGS